MEKLRNLAAVFPNTIIVIDHAGGPMERTPEYFNHWKRGMQTAAEAENIICKISGLGMGDQSWTVESIRPYVLHCIETFGVERSLFATNWPVDSLWSGLRHDCQRLRRDHPGLHRRRANRAVLRQHGAPVPHLRA